MTTQELVLKNLERIAAESDRSVSDILKLAKVDGGIMYGDNQNIALDVDAVGRIANVMSVPLFKFFLYTDEIIMNHAAAYGYERIDEYREPYEALLLKYSGVMEKIISLKESAAEMKNRADASIDMMQQQISEIINPES
jgi:hypothetical protein